MTTILLSDNDFLSRASANDLEVQWLYIALETRSPARIYLVTSLAFDDHRCFPFSRPNSDDGS